MSGLVRNPEDWFSRVTAQMGVMGMRIQVCRAVSFVLILLDGMFIDCGLRILYHFSICLKKYTYVFYVFNFCFLIQLSSVISTDGT